MAKLDETVQTKRKRVRSPGYPHFDLQEAIRKAEALYEQEKRNYAPLPTVVSHWGFTSSASSSALKAVATLKKFGLLAEEGTGKKRTVGLSPLALKIVLDTRAPSPDRDKAIKDAALKPRLYASLWSKWGEELPSEDTMEYHLRHDLKFNDDVVKSAINVYKKTISFAKLQESDIIEGGEANGNGESCDIGDYVQWESQGALQFEAPRKVLGLSDDGEYAFVEGTKSGLAVSELTIMSAPDTSKAPPPANPFGGQGALPNSLALPVLMEGAAITVHIPKMTEAAFEFFKKQLDVYRSAIVQDASPDDQD